MVSHPALARKVIDMLFLDNTFFNPSYDSFPSTEDATASTISLLKRHPFVKACFRWTFWGKSVTCMMLER